MSNEQLSSSDASADRRRFPRYHRWFPVTIDAGDREVWAICRDVSENGMLVAAREGLSSGSSIVLRFKVTPTDDGEQTVRARVVRVEPNSGELELAFPVRLGLHFDRPVAALERGLREEGASLGVAGAGR